MLTEYGMRCRVIRHTTGWSQEELAHQIGVDVKTLSRWEREENDPRNAEHRRAIQRLWLEAMGGKLDLRWAGRWR